LHAGAAGWELAPAFDLNPNPAPGPRYLSTTIDLDDASATVANLLAVAAYFRVEEGAARTQVAAVAAATSAWRTVARDLGISSGQIRAMEPAFEHEERSIALDL
jgi:serine/threonine-protein kinase HipA